MEILISHAGSQCIVMWDNPKLYLPTNHNTVMPANRKPCLIPMPHNHGYVALLIPTDNPTAIGPRLSSSLLQPSICCPHNSRLLHSLSLLAACRLLKLSKTLCLIFNILIMMSQCECTTAFRQYMTKPSWPSVPLLGHGSDGGHTIMIYQLKSCIRWKVIHKKSYNQFANEGQKKFGR